jgi:predicted metal-dependent phosphoesterase TrpH
VSADPPTFDLQSHSVHSDGALPASQVVEAAAAAGVELMALSDHDSIDGVQEAIETAGRLGIGIVPAVEISALDEAGHDLHILGYMVDHTDPGLLECLEAYREDREGRADRMAAALKELGYELDEASLAARAAEGKSIGRPHLARAVVTHPANAERLEAEGLTDPSAFLVEYLIEGKKAFRSRTIPTVPQSIEAIHSAGGVAVWAHPFFTVPEREEVLDMVDEFQARGLDGVEAFYVTNSREETEMMADRCERLGMLTTGSADFHGPEHREFSRWRAFCLYGREPNLGPITG